MTIALLEDDPVTAAAVAAVIGAGGWACVCFQRGHDLIQALRTTQFDLFVLDWNLPDVSGLTVLDVIRHRIGPAAPVLLLTSRASEEDVVAGLNAGADDFVTKPFTPMILQARLAALLRRTQPPQEIGGIEQYGAYAFDLPRKLIRVDGVDASVTAKEFQLALLLFRNLGRAVSRHVILESVWGMRADIPTRTLDSHVTRLRSKLALKADNGLQLASVYGFGYRLEEVARR